MQPDTMLSAALMYAKRGWHVFPCKPYGKNPLTEHGFHDATIDVPQIGLWWTRWPNANVAIATGNPGPDVLDFDIKDDRPGDESYNRLLANRRLVDSFAIVETPSGGRHVYFDGTAQHNGAQGKTGVDFRGDGGYVLAPPSHVVETTVDGSEVIYAGYYLVLQERPPRGVTVEWQAIKDYLVPPAPTSPRSITTGTPSGRINGVLRAFREAQPGERNHMLYWAAKRLTECDASDNDFLDLRTIADEIGTGDIDKTIRSGRR